MNPSDKFVDLLSSVHTLLSNYPMHTEIATIQIDPEPVFARQVVSVQLDTGRLAELAAGLIEWDRTLARGEASIWRVPDGSRVHVAVAGVIDEDDTPVEAWGGVPYTEPVFGDLLPGARHPVDRDQLSLWAIDLGEVTP